LASFCVSKGGGCESPVQLEGHLHLKDIFRELGQYCKSPSKTIAGLAISAVGEFAVQFPGYSEKVIERFVNIIKNNKKEIVVRYAVLVIKRLFTRLPSKEARRSTLIKLFQNVSHLEANLSPTVATIYWLITWHLHELEPLLCLDFLRVAAKQFQSSSIQVKLQMLFLCARIQAIHFESHPIISYVYSIAYLDPESYEVRDLARTLKSHFHQYMKNIVGVAGKGKEETRTNFE
jgi:hypothetical protein